MKFGQWVLYKSCRVATSSMKIGGVKVVITGVNYMAFRLVTQNRMVMLKAKDVVGKISVLHGENICGFVQEVLG